MKILLLGEFSALHKNLKEGLVELGHEVTIASSGDGWKKISNDIDFGSNKNGFIGKLHKVFNLLKAIPKLRNYDVVQFVSPVVFPRKFGINNFIVEYIIRSNKKVFLVGAGATSENSAIADFFENEFKYPELFKVIKNKEAELWSQTEGGRAYNKWFLKNINGYIPIMYEYAQPYRNIGYKKLCETIPIPMNIDKVSYIENNPGNKIVFFHGINREEEKGTPLIREAMSRLQKNYPNDVVCKLEGKLPLDEYLELLKTTNVVIDQVYSASVGVNGIYNLALGKVVVGGGDEENLEEFNIARSPLIPIKADVDDIYSKLEEIVINRENIKELGLESRRFAEDVHDYKKIAAQYIETWAAN